MRTGLLRGRDHTRIGAIATLAEGRAALALSRGGAKKNYDYTDPNEDACAFALTEHAWLAAVADGHWGCDGAERALERLLERHAPRWVAPTAIALAERWADEAPDVVLDLNRALLAPGASREAPAARTTLSLCLVRPRDGWWSTLCLGDSHVFRVEDDGVREYCSARDARAVYVGDPRIDRDRAERSVRVRVGGNATRGAVVLATDGLSERGIGVEDPAAAVAATFVAARHAEPDVRGLAAARGVAERALDAQRRHKAGDNVATACLWLE